MLPLQLQPESHVPLYVQLRDQLRALVHSGDLRPGDRIPASRELATQLGVHRTTVANAYAELESEGLIQGHVGRGTFIRNTAPPLKISPPPPTLGGNGGVRWESLFADERGEEALNRLMHAAPEQDVSFVMACPAEEFFPVEELRNCCNTVLRREAMQILRLGPSDGYPPLKKALVALVRSEGTPAQDENLLITDGCQQSFDLLCKAFLRPGDAVLLENPAYPGAIAIFAGARVRCLRVRWCVAPANVIERLRLVKQSTDLHTDQLSQATLAEFMRRGLLARHLARMCEVYTRRLEALEEALAKHMPEGTYWTRPEGGMCLWVELPPGFDASELLIHVRERGVLFAPGRYFYFQNPQPNTLRLGFAGLDERRIARGVATLGELLRVAMRKRQRGGRYVEGARVALV